MEEKTDQGRQETIKERLEVMQLVVVVVCVCVCVLGMGHIMSRRALPEDRQY